MLSRRIIVGSGNYSRRQLHSSCRILAASTKGQAPPSSRQPIEQTHGEQNSHLKHSGAKGENKSLSGKGNAARDPKLPSHEVKKEAQSPEERNMRLTGGARELHTSAISQQGGKQQNHSADSYFKDVDTSPPANAKTRRVDGTANDLQRPYETVNGETPFELSVEEKEQKEEQLRYGGVEKDSTKDTSSREEGPESGTAGGMKPEKR